MTVLHDSPHATAAEASAGPGTGPAPGRAIAIGALSAAVSLVPLLLVTLVAMWADSRSSQSAWDALGVGALGWLALHGTPVDAAGATISLRPLLLAAVPFSCAFLGARRVVRECAGRGRWWKGVLPAALAPWWFGYAACSLLALGLTLGGPARPVWWTLVLPLVVVPALAAALALRRERAGWGSLAWRIPLAWRRGLAPGLRAAALLLVAGTGCVLVAVALGWGHVLAVNAALSPGLAGGAILTSLQVAALPNLATWALSFLAGPGFVPVAGASVTWAGVESAVLPIIPVYGALPEAGTFPRAIVLSALVPVLVGAELGRSSLVGIARLSTLRTKAATATAACVVAAAAIAALDLLGGGSLGAHRLSSIGAPAHWLFLALLGELLAGALGWVLWDVWRLRR